MIVSGLPLQAATFVRTGVWAPEASTIALAAANTTTRVSLTASGGQATSGGGTWVADAYVWRNVSDDGRYIVFWSSSTDLPGGGVAGAKAYVRDTQLGTTTLVSVDQSGAPASADEALTISGDGRYVAFASSNSNIVPGDTNGTTDVFVRDLVTSTTICASVDGAGVPVGGGKPFMSRSGTFVVMQGGVPGVATGIFLRDLITGTTDSSIAIGNDGQPPNSGAFQPTVSDDGRYVSFWSRASNLSPIPKNNNPLINDVYVRDRGAGTTVRASVGPGGVQGDAQSTTAVLSGDGRKVLFRSGATNLVPVDPNFDGVDLFVRDSDASLTTRVAELSNAGFISADGRYIAFESTATNLVPGDTNGTADVFLLDQSEGTVELISKSSSGTIGDQGGWHASVTPDGRFVVFASGSTNLVTGDTNGAGDVFLRDRGPVDAGAAAPYTYGDDANGAYTDESVNVGTGVYTTSATDLAMPGRLLPLSFTRAYNSADNAGGPLGPGWSHSFYWKVVDAGGFVTLRRGDGQRDRFTRNPDGTYTAPPNVFDTLTKNGNSTYTLTLKNQTQFEFSTTGALTSIHEPAGNQITLTYTTGNLTAATDAVGRAVTLSYTNNLLTQIQDPLGRKVTYAYDGNGRLQTVTDKIGNAPGQTPSQHQWKYAYDGTTQHLTTVTDPDNRVRITNTYDASGRVYQQRDALSKLTTITFNPDGTTTTTDPRLHSWTQSFDTRKRALIDTRVVSGQMLTETRGYDASGNLEHFTDRNGYTTDYTYDTRGNVLTRTDPQVDPQIPRYVTQFFYDSKNNLYRVVDARNFETTATFDPTTNVLLSASRQIDATTSAVTKWEYADATNKGMPTRIIAPRGNTGGTPDYTYATNLAYDSQGNLTTRIDPDGAKTTFGYDTVGRQTSRVDPDGNATGNSAADHTWSTSFDENDQVKTETNPLGAVMSYAYNASGDRTSLTDRNGNVTTYVYDANARLFQVKQKPDPVGNPSLVYTTQIDRDANGNAIHLTQGNGIVTDYDYDELDRLISWSTHPAVGATLTTTLTLDGNGNVLAKVSPPGADQEIVTSTFDAINRLKNVSATGLVTITYDYDPTSNRTQMLDATGTTTYQYDGLGRMTQAAQPNGTLNYTYDRDGNRTSLVYPASIDTVTYFFTPGGRLDHLTDAASRTSTYTYTPSGLAKTLALPNGMITTYAYDRAQRPYAVANTISTITKTRHVYTLDAEGNRTALDEFVEGITTAPATTWAASIKVNGDTGTAVQDHPAIALGADGGHYLIWDDARDGNANVYFSRRDPSTGAWSTNVKVNSDTGTRVQVNPALSLDASSNVYAVWEDSRDGPNNKIDTNIYGAKRTGSTWGANSKVNSDTQGNPVQRNPRISGTPAGAQTAVWVDLRSSQNNIYSAQLAAGAATWPTTANLKVTNESTTAKDFPDVLVGPDGTSYAVWQDSRNGNPDIYFAKLPVGGTAWTNPNVKISDDPGTASQHHPRIGIDAAGNLTVVWLDERTSPAQMRMSRLITGSGTWTPSTVVADAAAQPLSVALSVRADGRAYVAFHDNRGSSTDVYGSEYDPWTNSWTTSALVSDDPGAAAQQSPTVSYGLSELAAAWRDDRAGNADVRARRATLTGNDHFALAYDGLERLKDVNVTNPESFTLDGGSNIIARTGPSKTFTIDGANRPTSDGTNTFIWSNTDRLIARGADSFLYDPLDRLTQSTVTSTTRSYTYNGDGLLQSRTSGTTVSLLWDPVTSPSRLLVSGSDRVIYGLGPLYSVNGASVTTYARDGQKSFRAELSGSSITASWRYRMYGEIAQSNGASTPSVLGYAGQLLDPSGLYYMRARWYDAAIGRFTGRDPIKGAADLPFSLNAYIYGGANPVRFDDASGMFCLPCAVVLAPAAGAACVRVCPVITSNAQAATQWVLRVVALGVLGLTAVLVAKQEPVDENPPAKNLKDVKSHERANEVADELGYQDADDLKEQNNAGAADIITVNKKTGDVWIRRPGGQGPGTWVGKVEP